MTQLKKTSLFIMGLSLLSFQACKESAMKTTSVASSRYYYSGIYFGQHFPPNYQRGIVDGCETSKGKYQKSHYLFKSSKEYEDGWFLGRNRCIKLLRIRK